MNVPAVFPAVGNTPVVDSFSIAAQVRMTSAGTRARLIVALPQDVLAPAATLVPALLSLGQQVLQQYRLIGQQLPEVEATAVERTETLPASAVATGFTVAVTNDRQAQRSTLVLDSDYLLGNEGGVLLVAATLFAGAEHLMDPEPFSARHPDRERPPTSQHRRGSRGKGGRGR